MFTGTTHYADEGGGVPHFSYAKADRRVTAYYFYLVMRFWSGVHQNLRVFSVPIKIWVNGQEYAKCRAVAAEIAFTGTDSPSPPIRQIAGDLRQSERGDDPGLLRALVGEVTAAVDRGRSGHRLLVEHRHAPNRGLPHDRVRRTPPRPEVFEALFADNRDVSRPEEMQIVFGRRAGTPLVGWLPYPVAALRG